MLWVLALVAGVLLFYYFLVKPQQYWSEKSVIQGIPIPLLGDNFRMFIGKEAMADMVTRIFKQFKGERYAGIYQTTLPILMLRDPDLIKQITVKDFDHFVDHRQVIPDGVDALWSKNLFALKGDSWRQMRATLSPAFTASKMRSMFVLMDNCAQQYVDFYLNQKRNVIDLELKDSFTRFANDVIASCAFGVAVDSLKEPENEFYLNGKEATNTSGYWKTIKYLLNLMAPKIASYFKLSVFSTDVTWFFKKIVHDTVKMREEQNIVRPDMINLLMEARKGLLQYEDSNERKDAGFATAEESAIGKAKYTKNLKMTETEMAAQALIFFFAGFDTISTMMTFLCYELALHADIQARLYREIVDTYEANKGKLSYDVLSKMKYLDMVISESMRKHAPAPAVDRVCIKPYTIEPERRHENPVHLLPGAVLWLPISGIHHCEEFYPNPERFDPERFSDENIGKIKPYTYIPFGAGPRSCIGSRFALMECKTLMFHILRIFELTVTDKTPIPIKLLTTQFNPAIEGGCWIGFTRRT